MKEKEIRWAVFVSGRGSNLENFIYLEKNKLKKNKLVLVHANKNCPAIEKAKLAGKITHVLSPNHSEFTPELLKILEAYRVDRIFLLGYMRILPKEFLESWTKPIINLHPSLLPKYKGLEAIRQAYEAGDEEVGVSLHEVVEELDSGKILSQKRIRRSSQESLLDLEVRIHELEYEIVAEYLFGLESQPKLSLG